jgi:hypothetical protein
MVAVLASALLLAGVLVLAGAGVPASAAGLPGPTVTLSSPAQGALITDGQPTFAGSGGTDAQDVPAVTVRVYTGASASGAAIQVLTTPVSPQPGTDTGSFTVAPNAPLGDGQYTAQAEQDTVLGGQGFSSAVTFTVHNALPAISLDAPDSATLTTATPTLTGTAGTASGDSASVGVFIYPGPNTDAVPVELLSATAGSGGRFSAKVSPALDNGEYTAVAFQQGVAGVGTSTPQTFTIKVKSPGVTVGTTVTLAHSGTVSVPVRCLAPVSERCTGTALVLTVTRFRPVSGGPAGNVQLLFAYVDLPGASTTAVTGKLHAATARALRRASKVQLRVSTAITDHGRTTTRQSATRSLVEGA